MSTMALYDQSNDAYIGDLSEAQFDVLAYYLRLAGEDTEQNEDHRLNQRMLDVIAREAQRVGAEGRNLPTMGKAALGERAGARAVNMTEVVALLREALDDRNELIIRWQEV